MMMRVLTIASLFVLASAAAAVAQSVTTVPPSQNRPLADVARDEEARRKSIRKPAKTYTNSDLRPDFSKGSEPAAATATTTPEGGTPETPGATAPASPAPAAPAGEQKDQKYWADRMARARADLDRLKLTADSLQTRINVLTADIVNLDYPARGAAEGQRNSTLAELDRVKQEMADATKRMADIEEEARRAGVPPGWLRPPV